jgi:endonuclease/exonuclease/phosphatase (EEP) superfamily protein YafD
LRGAAEQINHNMPAIVAGDFNATRYCRITRDLARDANLRDAAAPIRFSWPNTWSSFAMGIRIDHTLISDHFRVVDVHKGADIGSDHFPIVTTLQLVRESVAR